MGDSRFQISLIDGKRKAIYSGKEIKLSCRKNILSKKVTEWQVRLENISSEEKWLEVRISFLPDFTTPFKYWDGQKTHKVKNINEKIYAPNADPADGPEAPLIDYQFPEIYFKHPDKGPAMSEMELMSQEFSGISSYCIFPLQCIWDHKEGIGIGVNPRQFFSYATGGYDKDKGGLFFGIKVVLHPHKKETVKFLVFELDAHWGWRSGLSQYYRLFPDIYQPRKDIPEHIGPGETYNPFDAYKLKNAHLEDFRRFRTRWTWGISEAIIGVLYLQAKYGKEKVKKVLGEYRSLKRYRYVAKRGFSKLKQIVLPLFGITFERCDLGIARKFFSDSLWIRSDGSKWVEFKKVLMWAYKNSYSKHLKEDAVKVMKSYQPSGFIFDNCGGPRPYFGPTEGIPGIAFTHGKKYSTQGIGHSDLMRFMQTLETCEGKKAIVAANTPADYMTCRFCDIAIIEAGPWLNNDIWGRGLRYLMGKKPIVWWGPKGFPGWLHLNREELAKGMKERVNQLILYSIELGGMPNTAHAVRGFPEMQRWLPYIISLAKAGWEPVTGAVVTGNDKLRIERFGERFISIGKNFKRFFYYYFYCSIAPNGHISTHSPHPLHKDSSILGFSPSKIMAGHAILLHIPQALHFS